MPRNPDIPKVNLPYLHYRDQSGKKEQQIKIDSKRWFEWLTLKGTRSFAFQGYEGWFTARKEQKKRGSEYWYAYRWLNGKTAKAYLGTSDKLTGEKLNEVAVQLSQEQQLAISLWKGD